MTGSSKVDCDHVRDHDCKHDCEHYRTAMQDVQVRMSTKDPTKHIYEEALVRWCTHSRSPVNYTKARTFGGAARLQCGGCLARCPIDDPSREKPGDFNAWVQGQFPR